MMRQVSSPVRRGAGRKGQETDLARGLPSGKRRDTGQAKGADRLEPKKGTVAGTGFHPYPVMDTPRSRRTESTSPILINPAERGQPVSFLPKER